MVKQFQTTRNSTLIFNWVFITGLITDLEGLEKYYRKPIRSGIVEEVK